jgi:hypothetical protein
MCSIHGSHVNDYRWFKPLIERNITPEHFAFYSPLTRAWEFVVGVLVALLLRLKVADSLFKVGSLFTFCGAGLVLFGVAWASKYPEIQHEANWSTNTSATLAVTIGAAFWVFGGSQDRYLGRLISIRPLTLIGDCSYSIYLLHWPIWILLITSFKQTNNLIAVAFVLSFGMGWLQFRFIEEPIRLRKSLSSTTTLRFVGVFGLVAVVGFAVMSYATPIIGMHLAGIKPGDLALHIIERPCVGERFELESAQSCVYTSTSNQGTAILVGDSMAKSLSDGFVQASTAEGLNSYVFSYPGCAFQIPDSPFTATNECVSWRTNVLSALQQLQPRVLVIANLGSLYVDPPLPDWSVEETLLIWGNQLTRTLSSLSDLNTRVILAEPPPRFAYDLRYDLSLLWPNSVKEPRETVVTRRESINAMEQKATVGFSFVQPTISFTDQFCSASICDPKVNDRFMLEDDSHLSADGSFLVSPQLQKAISDALLLNDATIAIP